MRDFKQIVSDILDAEINANGSVNIEAVSELVDGSYCFDAERARAQEIKRVIRGQIVRRRDADGDRTTFAVKGINGYYIELSKCKNKDDIQMVIEQLRQRKNGINRSLRKANRRITQIDGQISLFEVAEG